LLKHKKEVAHHLFLDMTKNQIYESWKCFFIERGLDEKYSRPYLVYIKKMLSNGLPIIFETEHLSLLLGRSASYLNSVAFSPSSHYRQFKLKKRSGGFRTIDVPYPALLECQYWIYRNILSVVPLNYCAHGFVPKKSIITNAKVHLGQNVLLKLDIEDFFPSISKDRVIGVFNFLGYPPKVSYFLASLCCLNECVPQGAPTSPTLSNIISYNLDKRILAFSKNFELKYTRYADDLAISGKNLPTKYIDYLRVIVEDEGFKINVSKTQLFTRQSKRILTGVSIGSGKLKAPKEYKRVLFQELFYIKKFGLNSHISKMKIRNPNYIQSLVGKLNYILSIEKDNFKAINYLNYLKENYNSQIIKIDIY